MTQVTLPELGDGIESGDILEIFVAVGDVIRKGQDIVEMETDKATVPVPASIGGKVTKILVSEGDTVPIGGAILEVEAVEGAQSPEPPAKSAPDKSAPDKSAPAKSAAGKSVSQESDPELAEARDPAPATAPRSVPRSAVTEESTPAPAPTAKREPVADAKPRPVAPTTKQSQPQPQRVESAAANVGNGSQASIAAGPAVRRFAREVGVDLSRVQGSGDHGRITRDDVLAVVRTAGKTANERAVAPAADKSPAVAPVVAANEEDGAADLPGEIAVDDFGCIRSEKMTKIRKTIAKQMHASWSNIPRVTNFDDADITDLEQLRQSSKEDYAAQGLKLTTMPFLIKAVATALRHNPLINAVIDQENEQIIYKDYVNVGIAVDTDRGLVVPVMRNADRLGVPEITRGLAQMAAKVRGGKFALEDIRGGTFSISNLGAIGGQYSTPIINLPEVAILLVGRSRKLPVVMADDSIKPRLMMPLSISYDHRLIDGATAARFLNDVIGYLEAPSRLLLAP
jgi:pyruvate dehydrogenase E2 component (dihydrolipoamide acetyltransferase)